MNFEDPKFSEVLIVPSNALLKTEKEKEKELRRFIAFSKIEYPSI